MKLTSRCGEAAVAGLNDALLIKAAQAKLIRTDKVRADTTVVEAAVAYPTDSGLLAKAVGGIAKTVARIQSAGGARRGLRTATGRRRGRLHRAINDLGALLQPTAVTADRGYGYASVESDLHELGVRRVAIPRASRPGVARRSSNIGKRSAPRSNGEPDAKDGSTTSNAAMDGTAPN
jgi:IS5 family transposase